ncbi:MAG: hypothetical protein K0R54_1851 [Clostridiaceae bacterium]|jgi:hypothetical protein|nr:hypothetical protein [Clostridiaceae bacterium]
MFKTGKYFIKSNKWTRINNVETWWKANEKGYTAFIPHAGIYTEDDKVRLEKFQDKDTCEFVPITKGLIMKGINQLNVIIASIENDLEKKRYHLIKFEKYAKEEKEKFLLDRTNLFELVNELTIKKTEADFDKAIGLQIDTYDDRGSVIATKEFDVDKIWFVSKLQGEDRETFLENYTSDNAKEIYDMALSEGKLLSEHNVPDDKLIR